VKAVKSELKSNCPIWLRSFLRTPFVFCKAISGYYYDFHRYMRCSAIKGISTQLQHEAYITALAHVLEKGLSMQKPRPGFGEDIAISLLAELDNFILSGFPECSETFQSGLSTVSNYLKYRHDDGTVTSLKIINQWTKLKHFHTGEQPSIVKKTRSDIENSTVLSFEGFAKSRHSVRNYAPKPIDDELIKKAVLISQCAPSACNRQASRVLSITGKDNIQSILSLQNGNRGFGHLADRLLLVTCDLQVFSGPNERNQAFIDGGMFAMSLLHALHFLKLGACALNCCNQPSVDRQLRKQISVPESEIFILLISVGHLPDEFYVANSKRKSLEDVYRQAT